MEEVVAVRLFVWHGDKGNGYIRVDALIHAVRLKNLSMVKFMIDQGTDVNVKVSGKSPLYKGIQVRSYQIVKLLVDAGANVNEIHNFHRDSMLHFTLSRCETPRVEMVKIMHLLIDSGADVRVCNQRRETPLHCASEYGCLESVERLIESGADVNARADGRMAYPIIVASYYRYTAIVQRLLQAGADVSLRNRYGEDALDCAKRCRYQGRYQDIVELLENHIRSKADAANTKL